MEALEACAQRVFGHDAKLEQQGSAAKHTCIFQSDFDYQVVTPKVKSVTKDDMELFGIALDALPESDEYAVKLNPVSEDDEGGGNDDEGDSDAEADAPATSSTSLGMLWSFQCDEHDAISKT